MSDKGSTVRVCIIGGGLGIRCLLPKFREIPSVEVVGFLTSDYNKAVKLSENYGIAYPCHNLKEICNLKPDLVCVASPNKEHYWQASAIIAKNINVLCEKPLCLDLLDTDRLLKDAELADSFLYIDLELRFNPYFQKIKELINTIGDVYYVDMFFQSSLYLEDKVKGTWNCTEEAGGGIRTAILPHFLDLLFFWLNKQCCSLRGKLYSPHNKIGASEFCNVSMYLEDNISVNLTATAILEGDKELNIIVIGELGKIEFDLKNMLRIDGKHVSVELPDYYSEGESIFRSSFACYARKLVNAIRERRPVENHTTAVQIHEIHRLLEDIKFSSKCGREIIYKQQTNLLTRRNNNGK